MTVKKVARAAVAILKTRKTIMPDKNTASSIMLAKKLILSYSPIRQLKNENAFTRCRRALARLIRIKFNAFGIIPPLPSAAFDDERALAKHLKVRPSSRPQSNLCHTPSNSPSLKAFCRHRRITAMQPVRTALAFCFSCQYNIVSNIFFGFTGGKYPS